MTTVHTDHGPLVLADQPLGTGGQARVFPVEKDDRLVVKLYHELDERSGRRLESMMRLPLSVRKAVTDTAPEVAWPALLARDENGKVVGYVMARIAGVGHVQLSALFSLAQRRRFFEGRANWNFLVGVAWNLSGVVARLHHSGVVVGDLTPANIVVDRAGFITLLDCDSMQFTDTVTRELFPCPVATENYAAPEVALHTQHSPQSDDFTLAILICQLLTTGYHPFCGQPTDGSEANMADNISSGRSYIVAPGRVQLFVQTVSADVLPPPVRDLAKRAFGDGLHAPEKRPTALEWAKVLGEVRDQVKSCERTPQHSFGEHLGSCPWCARRDGGLSDPFPAEQPVPPPPPPVPQPGPRRRRPLAKAAFLVLLAIFILLIIANA
ncbi:protein kinase domain-containing protein [Sphaerimonospora thailandensis]|uniref:non-specific serine/threonine protein kinase n=1 Tax=Sphaerimonospora thailandensis TaxID=795644 RepID=A0A8J3W1Q2_9ACTN|nr:hypothetical protein [Sphaerimonospora thailandensis]GIH72318.1 hypothetical protein Mth01_45710 [Sphaerimonospora thailandensis]